MTEVCLYHRKARGADVIHSTLLQVCSVELKSVDLSYKGFIVAVLLVVCSSRPYRLSFLLQTKNIHIITVCAATNRQREIINLQLRGASLPLLAAAFTQFCSSPASHRPEDCVQDL